MQPRELKRWGFERSLVRLDGRPYLRRLIVFLAGYTIRLHTFYRADDDRASHTHPWAFWTFPLTSYHEEVYSKGEFIKTHKVEAFEWHYRPPDFEHIVIGGSRFPFSTIVVTGRRRDTWGFYPEPGKFVNWKDWT